MAQFDSHRDEAYYRSIVEYFTDDFPWTYVDGFSKPETAFERAAELSSSVGELRLSHLYTDAELHLTLPDHQHNAALVVVMYHPLDRRLESAKDGFLGKLSRTHKQIANGYRCDYIEPVADPTIVLRATVPFDYTKQNLTSTMTAITATALRVQRLHQDIRAPISEVLAPKCPEKSSPDKNRTVY